MGLVYRPGHPACNENGMVERHLAGEPIAARSPLPFPMVHSDYIELQSQVDGKIYTSKSALRRSYRANGYIEVGNEELKPAPKPKPDRKAIRNAVGTALNRVGISVDG